jgi:hypothetical protein
MAEIGAPFKQTTTIDGDSDGQVVLGPVDVQGYSNLGFYTENSLVGGDNIVEVLIETGPTQTGPWVELADPVAADVAAEGAAFTPIADACYKWIRLTAKCAAGETTQSTIWLCASQRG